MEAATPAGFARAFFEANPMSRAEIGTYVQCESAEGRWRHGPFRRTEAKRYARSVRERLPDVVVTLDPAVVTLDPAKQERAARKRGDRAEGPELRNGRADLNRRPVTARKSRAPAPLVGPPKAEGKARATRAARRRRRRFQQLWLPFMAAEEREARS